VRIAEGAPEPSAAGREVLGDAEIADGWRLACQTSVCCECVIDVPETSRFASGHQILTEAAAEAEEVRPAVRKVHVELPRPTLAEDAPDLLRLEAEIGDVKVDLDLLRRLPGMLRDNAFTGTAVLADHQLIDFEPGDTTGRCFGAAFDVGTTTVVGVLLDLCTGDERAVVSGMNPQIRFGDDVLSRIERSRASADGLGELRQTIVDAVGGMIDELCTSAGVARDDIYEVTFAGNTTMEHLLCGLDVTQLGHVPFVPAHARGLLVPAAQMGLAIHPRGRAYVFPVVGGFVGGDTVAGMLATRLTERDGTVLMVDIGTNGEIVLATHGKLWAASTAAGPAFEGARISCGMRATAGAIEKVVLNEDVRFSVIGGGDPAGLCGSAMIDLAAALLESGIVASAGRLLPQADLPAGLPAAIRERVVPGDDGQGEFLLAADGDRRVALTQRDVRELQLATGAIRAGIDILLARAGLATADLDLVLIAGGFGSFIRRSCAQRIGLLPAGVDHQRIHYVGNASLNGGKWALLSTRARRRAEQLARLAKHVELSQDPGFQDRFAEAMVFPS
jgi:uncharacterized 2Fe-2S/4Fe-4S cluster protein (DUF4445 family)